ncbi:putative ribonuclease H-like domain-containing protein, partial [Tanacetum coccineum]
LGLWYPKVSSFDLEAYSDSDYAGANLNRKSTTGGCQFIGRRLISWQCKKQTIVATSTTEAEYVVAANYHGQNPVFHSKTKHIQIRHHFIRDAYEKKLIQELKIHTDDNVGDHTSKKAEGVLNLEELFILCTNLSNRVLALETSKDAQAVEILKLKDQIKKLKRKCKLSISHHRAWLKSVKRLSMKKRLGRKESISKQGRKNAKPEPTLDAFDDLDADGRDYMETEDVVKEGRQSNETEELNKGSGEKGGSTKELVSTAVPKTVSTARPELSTARPDVDAARQEDSVVEPRTPPTTTSIFDDEDITMAQTLIKMKEEKAKEKGVSIKDIEDSSRPARSILTLKPLPTIDPKDKGKSVLEEPEPAKKMTRSDFDAAQIARDAEIARQLQVDLQAEVERERQREEEASKAAIAETYDEVQAGIDADALFAAKLQQEEREEYTIEERAKFLAETIAAQRKFRAAQRSAEIRSRPPTKSQLRNLMMTYLKNMGGYKHSQLKAKTFAEIQGLYERQKRVIDDFKPMDSDDAVKDSKEAAGVHKQKVLEEPNSTKVEVKQEGHEESIRKRPGRRLKMKATKKSKRQKTDADLEEEEQLKAFLKIVPDEEGIIDYEVLEKRFPIINWESKFYDFDRHGAECIYYRIFRSDGSSRWIKTFSEMVTRFDRLDLVELYNLVMKRFETTTPEGVDLVLWGDLRIMFDANAEDELWQNQERWNLKSWDLYENCGVHTLILEDGTEIHMLAERKYPLTKETLERMLSLRLVVGTASEDAYTLLRFIQKQIDEYGSHDGA